MNGVPPHAHAPDVTEIGAHIRRGNLDDAERACVQALTARPDDVVAGFFLAFVLWRQGRTDAALDRCRQTLSLQPADAGLLSDLGNLMRELGAATEALPAIETSLRLRPGHTGTLYNRALALDALGREQEALAVLGEIRPSDATYAKARYLQGTIRQDLGDMAGAEADYLACIETEPGHASAWHALVTTRRYSRDDKILVRLEEQLARGAADTLSRCRLLFALAKLNDDIGQYERASEYLLNANRLVDARYDKADIEARLGHLRDNFQHPPASPGGQVKNPTPVFIVGLPRSGTTLVETLLERHPDITALGEQKVLPELITDFSRPPEAGELRTLGLRYLERLPPAAGRSPLVLDKMPENFWRLGHIAWMFPHAKIVYCRRDARDVAISNFFNLYASGNNFAYSLANLAHYSACHQAVMQHWRALLPGRIFQLDYAQLATRPQAVMTALMQFLGLDWNETPQDEQPKPTRRIRTASNWQVRQAIYTTSIDRWRNYPELARAFSECYRDDMQKLGTPPA